MVTSPKGKPGFQPLGDPNWLYAIPIGMTVETTGKITMDFEGTQSWGYHSMNCTPAAMDGGMFVTLTQHMNFEGLVNDVAWMATELKVPKGTWTNPYNEFCATAPAGRCCCRPSGCSSGCSRAGFWHAALWRRPLSVRSIPR